ncbi:DUF262 domain-containing protein [Microcoleus vaginatus]|uniref:DUF262 domain-containing protein n=1 Tax=Microcoleus vaginatus TaxID=119532 RepID=UPI0016840C4E|nr:DUF262 domain-containing protein [Microcoleus sp. FACHB-84]MBD2008808.1 DUF262 domain-containing protein [Microcoleus sp. FACHB-45]
MNTFESNSETSPPKPLADEEQENDIQDSGEDDSGEDEEDIIPSRFSIAVSRTDFDVAGLVRRLEREDVFIPDFQRAYVWKPKQASRFIESLLLGLPVPGIFLAKERETKKLLVIDGQQRLRSLLYFYQGKFPNSRHSFALKGVHTEFERETYKSLKDAYRRQLDDSVVSATVVEPLYADNESSIYYIFERLNTGGTILKPQEIRACIYHGALNNLLGQLNKNPAWRDIFGLPDKNGKDQELILRFLAFYFEGNDYKPSLKEFLNQYMRQNRHLARQSEEQIINAFIPTIEVLHKGLGNKAFKPQKLFIPTYFEAVMVVTARRLQQGKINNLEQMGERYQSLIEDNNFSGVAQKVRNLTSQENVRERLKIASYYLGNLE